MRYYFRLALLKISFEFRCNPLGCTSKPGNSSWSLDICSAWVACSWFVFLLLPLQLIFECSFCCYSVRLVLSLCFFFLLFFSLLLLDSDVYWTSLGIFNWTGNTNQERQSIQVGYFSFDFWNLCLGFSNLINFFRIWWKKKKCSISLQPLLGGRGWWWGLISSSFYEVIKILSIFTLLFLCLFLVYLFGFPWYLACFFRFVEYGRQSSKSPRDISWFTMRIPNLRVAHTYFVLVNLYIALISVLFESIFVFIF